MVRLGQSVEQIDDDAVVVGERIASKTLIWTAGVAPSPAGKWLQTETHRAGQVRVQSDLTVPGYPEIFVIGDTASFEEKVQIAARRCAGGDATWTLCRKGD